MISNYGHIINTLCCEMTTTVTAAHHFTWRYRYASNWSAQTLRRFVIACQIFSMNTIWQKEEALIRHSTEIRRRKRWNKLKGWSQEKNRTSSSMTLTKRRFVLHILGIAGQMACLSTKLSSTILSTLLFWQPPSVASFVGGQYNLPFSRRLHFQTQSCSIFYFHALFFILLAHVWVVEHIELSAKLLDNFLRSN